MAMASEGDYVTIYRSADANADADARLVCDQLCDAGLDAIVVTDDAPGVVVGTYEVRVPPADAARAEEILAASPEKEADDELKPADTSHSLDLESVFSSQNVDAEVEAEAVRGMLEANEIPAMVVGSKQIPVLEFEVRVPRSRVEEARNLIEEARATGPEMAEEAATESESSEEAV